MANAAAPPALPLHPDAQPNPARVGLLTAGFAECHIFAQLLPENTNLPVTGFTTQVAIVPAYDLPARTVDMRLFLHVDAENEGVPLPGIGARFELHFRFQVLDLPELLAAEAETGRPVPNAALTAMLAGFAYGTARGLILAKTASTACQGYYPPFKPVQELLTDAGTLVQAAKKAVSPKPPPKRARKTREQ